MQIIAHGQAVRVEPAGLIDGHTGTEEQAGCHVMDDSGESREVNCPRCGTDVPVDTGERGPYFPFCSRKCKLLDLGKWLEGEYRISEERSPSSVKEKKGS